MFYYKKKLSNIYYTTKIEALKQFYTDIYPNMYFVLRIK